MRFPSSGCHKPIVQLVVRTGIILTVYRLVFERPGVNRDQSQNQISTTEQFGVSYTSLPIDHRTSANIHFSFYFAHDVITK